MRRISWLVVLVFAFSILGSVSAQTQTPTPRPTAVPLSVVINSVAQIENSNSVRVSVSATGGAGEAISLSFAIPEYPTWSFAPFVDSLNSSGGLAVSYDVPLLDSNGNPFAAGTYTIQFSASYISISGTNVTYETSFDFTPVDVASITIDDVQPTPGTNEIAVTISGNFTPDAANLWMGIYQQGREVPLVTEYIQSVSPGTYIFSINRYAGAASSTSANVVPPGEYFIDAALLTASNQQLVSARSESFTFDAPYVEITSVTFEDGSNVFVIAYSLHHVSSAAIDIYDAGEIYGVQSIEISDETTQIGEVRFNANDVPPDRLSLSSFSNYINIRIRAEAQTPDGTVLALWAGEGENYRPSFVFALWWYARQFWYVTLAVILFVLWIVLRQVNWMQRVERAPLALISPQRQRVIRRKAQAWQSIDTLAEFLPQMGKPGKTVPSLVERSQTLDSEPDNFRTLRQYTDLVGSIYNAREWGKRRSPAKTYRNRLLEQLLKIIETRRGNLLGQYQAYAKWAADFKVSGNEEKHPSALDALLAALEQLRGAATRAQESLAPYLSYFTEANELESVQYLGELVIDLREVRANAVDNIAGTDVALERILTRINGYINALPPNELILNRFDEPPPSTKRVSGSPDSSKSEGQPVPLRELLRKFAAAVELTRGHIVSYEDEIIDQLEQVVASIQQIENIPLLERTLKAVKGDRFGDQHDPLQTSLDMLPEIAQDVSSAVSHAGFYRRLYLQDAHIKTRDLYARIKNELPDLGTHLLKMAQLFEEQHKTDDETDQRAYRNPYVTSTPVKADKVALFKGRLGITAEVINRLRDRRSGTLLLYGARRMGKSSFLYHLENMLPASHIPVFIDCQGGTTQDDGSFFYQLARNIYSVLRNRDPNIVGRITKPNDEDYVTFTPTHQTPVELDNRGAVVLSEADELVGLQDRKKNPAARLEEWLADEVSTELRGRILLITLDEFEEIGNAIRDGRMSQSVLKQIRHMIQHSEYLMFLFAGVATLDVLVHNAASYFISVHTIELSYLEDAAAEALIRRPFQPEDPTIQLDEAQIGRVPEYEDNAVAEIMRLTRNQPYLIQIMCETLIKIANDE